MWPGNKVKVSGVCLDFILLPTSQAVKDTGDPFECLTSKRRWEKQSIMIEKTT